MIKRGRGDTLLAITTKDYLLKKHLNGFGKLSYFRSSWIKWPCQKHSLPFELAFILHLHRWRTAVSKTMQSHLCRFGGFFLSVEEQHTINNYHTVTIIKYVCMFKLSIHRAFKWSGSILFFFFLFSKIQSKVNQAMLMLEVFLLLWWRKRKNEASPVLKIPNTW